jgi:hypothetical protein
MSPSLKNELEAAVASELARGARGAVRDLRQYDEIDAAGVSRIRATRYTVDQILGDWFPPDPGGPGKAEPP